MAVAPSTHALYTSEARTSTLTAGKDLTILATDGSITSQGAQISAEGNALILAKDSIKFDVAHTTETRSQETKKSGFSIDTRSIQVVGMLHNNGTGNGDTDTVTGTKLSVGGSTTMATQTGDITLTGANVVSEGNLSINAARDLTITSAQDTLHNANQSNNKAIGKVVISDTERFSGYHNEKHKDNSDQVTQVASNVSSLKGDVNLTAGDKYTQAASNVLAGNDVNITAKTIDITALQNTGSHQESNSDLKIGTFARISSPLIDLVNNVEAARKSDDRLKAMQGMAAAANGYQAASAISSMTGGPGSGVLVKGEAGIGFASSSNSSNGNDSTAQGSTINGGRNVNLTATGGDIHATGATLNAGKTLNLDAAQNIVVDASQSTLHSDGKNKSAGVEAGVGFQLGAQTGVYVYASASVGKGHSKNDSTINNNTELKADTVNISSKGDTTLKGATATANTINTDVGGKLAIESLQDTSQFDSVQTNAGVRVQVAIGNAWSASGNISQQKGSGTYEGVGQQSGLFAGDGGYHVKADSIDLKGGAIASTNAAASELSTNKLTTSDIENKMKYSASNVSMAGSIGGGSGAGDKDAEGNVKPKEQQQNFGTAKGGNVTPGLPMVDKGSDSSTTYATLTDGKITIGGVTTNSVKDLGINTDASKANTALDKLPDLQKLLKDQQAMSAAAGTVIATGKQIAGDIANEAAKAQEAAQKTLNDPKSTIEQRAEATKTSDKAQQTLKDWGTGGIYSRALNAGVGILSGALAGQGGGQITANAISPTVAKTVGDIGMSLAKEAADRADVYRDLADKAARANDPAAAAEYTAKANEAAATAENWGDNGIYRVGLHAATQSMLGSLSNGQTGAVQNAAGVVGGNLGQKLAAELGEAEAQKLGLKGRERDAFVNAFQSTGAVLGGMVAGAAAGSTVGGKADFGTLMAAAQGGQAAGTVDTFNRQLHPDETSKLQRLQKDRPLEAQQRLADAACALVHCSAQLSDWDPKKEAAIAQEERGNRYNQELTELKSEGLFDYGRISDGLKDKAISSVMDLYWIQQGFVRTKREIQNTFVLAAVNGPYGNVQAPPDLPDDFGGPKGSGAVAGGAVILPVPLCVQPPFCTLSPTIAMPGTRIYVPNSVLFSSGRDGTEAGSKSDGQVGAGNTAKSGKGSNNATPGTTGVGQAGTGAKPATENKLPSGVGGTGPNYDKVAGQGLYVLRDEAGNLKYVGRGDAPDRLATHADSIDKGDLIGEILWPNNLSKAQAKGLEQKLMDNFGGAARQNPDTPLLNQYRSYAPENPNSTLYRDSVTNILWEATMKKVGK